MVAYQLGISEYEDEDSRDYREFSSQRPLSAAGYQQWRKRRRDSVTAKVTTSVSTATASSLLETSNQLTQVVVMELQNLEEVGQVVQALQQRQSVVLNVTRIDPEQAQRAVDFVVGATYYLQGDQQCLAPGMFLFAPNCVQLIMHADS
jgi:cell division inhibitor SepF